ncbi:reverse transcriptase domain, reverse transcriptase zinc-binding domain protein [Tanacetum coccineum]
MTPRVKIGEEIDALGVEFLSSCVGVVGDGSDIRFWIDRWVDNRRLCDKFPRLYHLDRRKDVSVVDRGVWIFYADGGCGLGLDRWRWSLGGDGDFKRALRGRLSVRVELDRRGVDLDSVLCPCCNNIVETCVHSLITCDLAMNVWDKIYKWWKVGIVNAFSIDEFFSSNENVNVYGSGSVHQSVWIPLLQFKSL